MNEIILTGNTELRKSVLGRATEKIIKLINTQIRDEKQIAVAVAEVDRTGAAVGAGFKSTAVWAAEFLNFSKSKVSRYISITTRFKFSKVTDEQGRDYWDIFTLSQLQEMLKATDEQLQQITPDMTVKDIREYLSFIDVGGDDAEETTAGGADDAEEIADAGDVDGAEEIADGNNVDEYDQITVLLSVIKHHLLNNDGSPVTVVRDGNKFKIAYGTTF